MRVCYAICLARGSWDCGTKRQQCGQCVLRILRCGLGRCPYHVTLNPGVYFPHRWRSRELVHPAAAHSRRVICGGGVPDHLSSLVIRIGLVRGAVAAEAGGGTGADSQHSQRPRRWACREHPTWCTAPLRPCAPNTSTCTDRVAHAASSGGVSLRFVRPNC